MHGSDLDLRWVASIVARVLRILVRGTKDASMGGKLRQFYEANPMSSIVELAGSVSSSGYECILDMQTENLHQRVPVILGSKNEVEVVVGYHQDRVDRA